MFSRKRSISSIISSIISNGCRSKRRKTENHDYQSRLTQETETETETETDHYGRSMRDVMPFGKYRALERKIKTILDGEKMFKPYSSKEHVRPETNLQGRRHKGNGRWRPEETSVLLRMVLECNPCWRPKYRYAPWEFSWESNLKWNWVQEACHASPAQLKEGFYNLPAEELEWLLYMVKYRTLPAMRAHLISVKNSGDDVRIEWSNWKAPAKDGFSVPMELCNDSFMLRGTCIGWISFVSKPSSTTCNLRIDKYTIVPTTLPSRPAPSLIEKYASNGRIYHGELNYQGVPDGTGVKTYLNGDKYVGQWKKGQKHGMGTYMWEDGGKYEGQWVNDLRHGTGIKKYPDGCEYRGRWVKGQKHGYGFWTEPDGTRYEGYFKNNYRHGYGFWTEPDGTRYEGYFKNNYRHGEGCLYEPGVGCYSGSFLQDKRHGKGKQTHLNGDCYEGQWLRDKMHGTGTKKCVKYSLPWGEYKGEWKDGQKNGKGTYTFLGNRYDGQWLNDKKHGTGTFTWADGRMYYGQWLDNTYQSLDSDTDS